MGKASINSPVSGLLDCSQCVPGGSVVCRLPSLPCPDTEQWPQINKSTTGIGALRAERACITASLCTSSCYLLESCTRDPPSRPPSYLIHPTRPYITINIGRWSLETVPATNSCSDDMCFVSDAQRVFCPGNRKTTLILGLSYSARFQPETQYSLERACFFHRPVLGDTRRASYWR